jgi:hypothetical protein
MVGVRTQVIAGGLQCVFIQDSEWIVLSAERSECETHSTARCKYTKSRTVFKESGGGTSSHTLREKLRLAVSGKTFLDRTFAHEIEP